jgi:hypothetical protein
LFGAPPPANPARDSNRRNRWKSQRFRRLVSACGSWCRGKIFDEGFTNAGDGYQVAQRLTHRPHHLLRTPLVKPRTEIECSSKKRDCLVE